MKQLRTVILVLPLIFLLVGWFLLQQLPEVQTVEETIADIPLGDLLPRRPADLATQQRESCPDAPFLVPSAGYVGLYYNDPSRPYSQSRRHQGVDLFVRDVGTVPVYAVADGYISHPSYWQSAVIQRIPSDPLNPGQQIWVYYTHMADADGNDFIEPAFDYGASEVWAEQGTLIGYIGDYDGNQPSRIVPHLHVSIVRDDGFGRYLNELDIANTLDPSPYFGVDVGWGSDNNNLPYCHSNTPSSG